jgi:hypothetical protein
MKILFGLLAFLLIATTANGDANAGETYENGFSAVDPVSIKTAELRGKELYARDQYAWKATDLAFEKGLLEGDHGVIGFLTDIQGKTARTYFIKGSNKSPEIAFAIKFIGKKKPKLEKKPKASENLLNRFKARQVGVAGIDRYCSQTYNTVVLEDGDDYLVYALASTTEHGVIVVGGHYRFRVNKKTLELVKKERLSNTCLSIAAPESRKGTPVFHFFSHLVTDSPIETQAFLSLQHGALIVGTKSGNYMIVDGKITLVDE